ncbi:MAG: hypothetical protein C6W54_17500 [Bacillaceae bacterium]|nr:MAG: hypothetical protein C6W54_17500 [Bacillaceae bacterium]
MIKAFSLCENLESLKRRSYRDEHFENRNFLFFKSFHNIASAWMLSSRVIFHTGNKNHFASFFLAKNKQHCQ